MSTPQSVKTQVQAQPPQETLKELIKKSTAELGKALPSHMSPERVVRIALTCINQNPELMKCTPASFMGSLFVLAQIGLEPIAGRAYLLPFNNKRKVGNDWTTVKEVQALIGYKGYAELFYRHGSALMIDMQTVYKNDEFSYAYGTKAYLDHRPKHDDRGEAVGYYAIATLKGGVHVFRYMSKAECTEHGKQHSKTYNEKEGFSKYSPWHTDPDSMCMKTVLLQLSKLLPLSFELQRAISVDETSRDYRDGMKDVISAPSNTSWNENVQEAEITNGKTTEMKPPTPEELAEADRSLAK